MKFLSPPDKQLKEEQPAYAKLSVIYRLPSVGRHLWHGLLPIITLFMLFVIWQIYVEQTQMNPLILPTPTHIVQVTIQNWPNLRPAIQATLYETGVGFFWVLLFGITSAALLDIVPPLREAFYPIFVASQSVPIIALAPLLQLWFGIGLLAKVIVIVLITFFPITVAGLDGLRATDPELIRLYRSFGASRLRIFRSVRLPNAMPSFFSGIRIAISYSVIGAIFSEYIGADEGLGVYIRNSQHAFRVDLVIGAIGVTAMISIGLFGLVMLIERLVIPWFFAERHSKNVAD